MNSRSRSGSFGALRKELRVPALCFVGVLKSMLLQANQQNTKLFLAFGVFVFLHLFQTKNKHKKSPLKSTPLELQNFFQTSKCHFHGRLPTHPISWGYCGHLRTPCKRLPPSPCCKSDMTWWVQSKHPLYIYSL